MAIVTRIAKPSFRVDDVAGYRPLFHPAFWKRVLLAERR